MKKLVSVLRNFVEDIFIVVGLIFISFATFQWNIIAGWYCIGASCIAIGMVLARHPPERG